MPMVEALGYQKLAGNLFSVVPLRLLKADLGRMPLIGYYHLISDEEVHHIRHLYHYKNVTTFKKDLDYLLKRWKPINLFDLLGHVNGGREIPEAAFLITVDDGLREARDVMAPILLEKGVPAVFFLSSGFLDNKELAYDHKMSLIMGKLKSKEAPDLVEKLGPVIQEKAGESSDLEAYVMGLGYGDALVLDQIGEELGLNFRDYLTSKRPYLTTDEAHWLVRQGFALGAHGIDHPVYWNLSFEEQLHQTITSMNFVRKTFGLDYGAFAFPHGDGGITRDFFGELRKGKAIDISFGGAGIIEDSIEFHFQRLSLEAPIASAKKLISFQLARRGYRKLRGIRRIER